MSEWTYNNKPFDSDMIEDYIGFVYEVYDTEAKMKYIGKKKFWSKVTKPPLKGKKNKRRSLKESDWKDYYGSSEEVKSLVENTGEWRFKRKIIRLCKTLGEMSYYEMKEQLDNDVLLKPNEYYNAFVGGKIHRRHLGHLVKK
jgi:hypothetical protein|tara:strand:+ start:86 stop:511 length:426 start_codon:yes stop_codon:yes gene_type:complete